jgi:hypothetical protein
VPFDYAFPAGALFLGVDKQTDFDKLREEDNQARDADGVRVWVVTVMDQDPEAAKFGRTPQVKVKIAEAYQPVPPEPIKVAGMSITPVAFTDLMVTPYTDTTGCKGDRQPHPLPRSARLVLPRLGHGRPGRPRRFARSCCGLTTPLRGAGLPPARDLPAPPSQPPQGEGWNAPS